MVEWCTTEGKSSMYNKNNNGPRMDPWGAPDVTGSQLESLPFITIRWCPHVKKGLIQFRRLLLLPKAFNLSSKRLYLGGIIKWNLNVHKFLRYIFLLGCLKQFTNWLGFIGRALTQPELTNLGQVEWYRYRGTTDSSHCRGMWNLVVLNPHVCLWMVRKHHKRQ